MYLHFSFHFLYNEMGRVVHMGWIVGTVIVLIIIGIEAVFILPDKMPWNRRKKK